MLRGREVGIMIAIVLVTFTSMMIVADDMIRNIEETKAQFDEKVTFLQSEGFEVLEGSRGRNPNTEIDTFLGFWERAKIARQHTIFYTEYVLNYGYELWFIHEGVIYFYSESIG